MSGIFGILDDLTRGATRLRTTPTASLPGAADDVASRLDDLTGQLFDSPAAGADDLATDAFSLATEIRGAGSDLRRAAGERMLLRPFGSPPGIDEATRGVRVLADDVDDLVSRARTRVGDGAGLVDDAAMLMDPVPWLPAASRADDMVMHGDDLATYGLASFGDDIATYGDDIGSFGDDAFRFGDDLFGF